MDIKYTSVSNLAYSNAENTSILMLVKFEHNPNMVQFNASPNDPMDYGRQLYEDAVAGKFGPIKKYTPSKPKSFSKQHCKQVVQNILDNTAKQHDFDSMLSAVSYSGFQNEYQDIAVKLGVWRSKVWTTVETMLNQISVTDLSSKEIDKIVKNIPQFVE